MIAASPTHGHVVSRDGTRIGYLREGTGPGLLLVQGAMGTAHQFRDLARALAGTFTVYRPDRRGRGMSPKPYTPEHDIARDVEDVDALLHQTGTTRVFGLSSGAVIALEATLTLPQITHLAVYEPPFYDDGISRAGIRRLHAEIDRETWSAALVTALRTAETAPAPLRALPRPAAQLLTTVVLAINSHTTRVSPGATALRDLLPGIRYDFHVVASRDRQIDGYTHLEPRLLLLSGTKSPSFLQAVTSRLHQLAPDSRHVALAGLDHSGPWNTRQSDRHNHLAAALHDFLSDPD